jgi:hypothetical protein
MLMLMQRHQAVDIVLICLTPSSVALHHNQKLLLVDTASVANTSCRCCTWLPSQGVRTWVVLKSRRNTPVGAVQVALYWSQLGDVPHDTCPAAPSPLQR